MKKLIFLLSILNFCVHAQDTIRFRNGEVKVVKVTEVGINDVKYNRFDNIGGPLYIASKNDIRFVKYKGGDIDSFPIVKTEVKQIEHVQQSQTSNLPMNPFGCDKLVLGPKYKVICNGHSLSEPRFKYVLLGLPEGEKKMNIMKVHAEMKGYQKKQYQFGFGGLIVLAAAPVVGGIGTVFSDSFVPYLVGIAVGGIAAITGSIISKEYKQKRMGKRVQIVKMYNDEYNFQK